MEYFQFPSFRSLHADNCGCAKLSQGWSHPRRKLGSSVLILGVRGRVPIIDEGNERCIEPGSVTLLPAGRIHFGPAPISAAAMYYWFHFSTARPPHIIAQSTTNTILSDDDIIAHKLDGAALLPLHFNLSDPEPIYQSFRDLLFEQENPSYTSVKFQAMFQLLLIQLTEIAIAAHQPAPVDKRKSIVAYSVVTCVAESLTDPNLSIMTIASAIGMNPDYAGRRFKEVMGLSVGNYLLKKRVEMAIRLLQETNDTMEQIALRSGFGSVRNFLRQFKSEKGLTPTAIRQRHRMMHVNSL